MNLPKIHSITKKMFVGAVGAFLLLFLLFHMCANLCILRHDDGAWYSAFCHFMGTNWIVKVFEVVLLGVIALHILLTLWLVVTNRMARPQRYHERPRTKTHTNSRFMALTGILIFVLLIVHFCDFYFVKLGWVKGEYMVKTEKLINDDSGELLQLMQYADRNGFDGAALVANIESQAEEFGFQPNSEELQLFIENIRNKASVIDIILRAEKEQNFSQDHKWVRHLTYDERNTLRRVMPESDPEPDFYFMAREKFKHAYMVIMYLIFFVVVFLHISHAFPSVFQTFGLNNYKYNGFIEVLGKIYSWVILIGFSAVPLLVFFGL
ncbi:MAG: hypothetical protein IJ761_00400 [Bacteroidales bacterium]|nr:hypothetical protein [Bacteroidales bacterium]